MRTAALETADQEDSFFTSPSEVDRQLNLYVRRLYDLLIDADAGWVAPTVDTALVTVAGVPTVDLPADAYRLRGLDVLIDGYYCSARPLDFARRNEYQEGASWELWRMRDASTARVRYLVEGTRLRLFPTPDAVYSLRLWYYPTATYLSNDNDTFDGINGWEQWVELSVAIWLKNKEEADPGALLMERGQVETAIMHTSRVRDTAEPERPRDVLAARGSRWP